MRIRIASIGGDQWLDATSYELPPTGMLWDRIDQEWMTPAELRKRKLTRAGKAPIGAV